MCPRHIKLGAQRALAHIFALEASGRAINREDTMLYRQLIGAVALAVFAASIGSAQGFDEAMYPNLKGQWTRRIIPGQGGQPSFDQTKPWGFGQQAPLTPEYTKVLQDSLADQAKGGQGNHIRGFSCEPYGMPMMTLAFWPQEYVITPDTTHILVNHQAHTRRIYTDGRDWPTREIEPTYAGYSIGRWIDEDGDGRYDVLEIETRGPFKGPRVYDGTGLPLHHDNQSIFKERIYLDKANSNVLHNEITVIDHALTRPWTVDKQYVRNPDPRPIWPEDSCEGNMHVRVGTENYFISGDGFLMPARKDQPLPDLRYFKRTQK
jgi:hypothetical protein